MHPAYASESIDSDQLAYAIAKIVPPPGRIVEGKVKFMNRDLMELNEEAMRGIRGRCIGFVFQDPLTSLDPLRTVGDQLAEVIQVHLGISGKEAIGKAGELLELVNILRDGLNYYLHQLSGGRRQRIIIARATMMRPMFVVLDEPVSIIDGSLRASIFESLKELKREYGLSMLFITHDLAVVELAADRVAVMYLGKVVEEGAVGEVIHSPLHPYT